MEMMDSINAVRIMYGKMYPGSSEYYSEAWSKLSEDSQALLQEDGTANLSGDQIAEIAHEAQLVPRDIGVMGMYACGRLEINRMMKLKR